jgi:DNA-binding NarL/FixJ family response regulator
VSTGAAQLIRPELTPRELDVLRGMANGRSNRDIAAALFVSEATVKVHSRRLFEALHAADRAHAVALGFVHGFLRSGDIRIRPVSAE